MRGEVVRGLKRAHPTHRTANASIWQSVAFCGSAVAVKVAVGGTAVLVAVSAGVFVGGTAVKVLVGGTQ